MAKLIFHTAFAAALIFSNLFLLPKTIFAATNYQYNSVIFSDDFNDGNFNGWIAENHGERFSVNNSNLLAWGNASLQTGRLTNSGSWDNYSVEVDLNNNSGVDEGVGFRRSDASNAYELNLRHGTGQYNTPEIILSKIQNGVTTVLVKNNTYPLKNQQWYHVKIETHEEHIQVYIDSELIFEIDDPQTTVKTGGVSLSYWTGDLGFDIVRFDNVKVTSLTLAKQLYPVIFIPGIGGSEFIAGQDIIWSGNNGHDGIFSYAYPSGEKIWINEGEAAKLGDDDYFDVLKLKADGKTPEAPGLTLNSSISSLSYGDIDPFFTENGYTKDTNFFIFTYDWRKDISETWQSLDTLVENAKQKSEQPKVNIVAHSMGGLVARYYISEPTRADKVNKLIQVGVPHLGSVDSVKALMYGSAIQKKYTWYSAHWNTFF